MADKKLFKEGVPVCGETFFLKVSKDKLEAVIVSDADEKPDIASLDKAVLMEDLKNNGIIAGVLDAPVPKGDGIYIVAQGRAAVHGENAIFKTYVKPSIVRAPKSQNTSGDQVDYRELGSIVNVPKDKLLIRKIPPTTGTEGEDVFGDSLKAKPGKDQAMKVSTGVELSEDGLDATSVVDGKFMMADGKASVVTEHVISGDIDMKIGNIAFVGARLLINGTVLPGFRVKGKGDIYIAKGVENSVVIAGGNMEIKGGVIGEDVILQSWGNINVDFVENVSKIEARGSLTVTDSIIQAKVKTGGDVTVLQGKGTLIGGEYIVGGSVRVKELGSDAEVHTDLQVGINPELEDKKKKLQADKAIWPDKMSEILKDTSALKKMQKSEGANFPEEKKELLKKLNSMLPTVMEKVNEITERETAMDEELAKSIDESVYVYGTVFPGVSVTIGGQKRVLINEERNVVIYFDKESHKIKFRPMTSDEKEAGASG